MNLAKERITSAWFFSGRNWAMHNMMGSRFSSVKGIACCSSFTATGG